MVTSSTLGLTGRAGGGGGGGGGGRRGAKRSRPPAPRQIERNFCAHLRISGNGRRPLGVSNILGPVYSTDSSPIAAGAPAPAVHRPTNFASKPPRRPSASSGATAAAAACAGRRTSCARAAAIALVLAATFSLSTAAAAAVGGSEFGRTAGAGAAATTSSRLCSPADDSRAYVTTIAPDEIIHGDHGSGGSDDDAYLPRAS
ncbi:unnamed protein product, partial [Laminaria digitata]